MKLLVICADAISPEIVLSNPKQFPTLSNMVLCGASATYSAFVQRGYSGSFSSEQNWASIYTGLAPNEHNISTFTSRGNIRRPIMSDFNGFEPLWEVFNTAGFSVGLWTPDCCFRPVHINGYTVSAPYEMITTPQDNRESHRILQLCKEDAWVEECFDLPIPPKLYPRTLKQMGVSYERLKQDTKYAENFVEEYHFQESLDHFKSEIECFWSAIYNAQRVYPVDVLFFYTPYTDVIGHCSSYKNNYGVTIEALAYLDQTVGSFIEKYSPERVVFLSDHGQGNLNINVKCSDLSISREAFSKRDNAIWFDDGTIAMYGNNGALVYTTHSLHGTFIVSGKGIKHTEIKDMRTLDIYPTLLEMLGCKVPDGRQGYVVAIFDRPLVNANKLIRDDDIEYKSIAVIQCHRPGETDIFINEVYIENRFCNITVVGETKYGEIFLNNPRVSAFMTYDEYDVDRFDAVFCGVFNETTGFMQHVRVK